MWRYAVLVVLFMVCCNAVEIEVQELNDLEELASLLGDSDPRSPRCKRSIENCAHNSNDSCCLHFDCMRNYICCTNLEPKPSNCPAVIQRCCPPPLPPTYCQANFICCTNAEPKPQICLQVKPRCCPAPPLPTPPPPCPSTPTCPPQPPPIPYCQANYICCTHTVVKPLICEQVIPRCCPIRPPPPTRPPLPPVTCKPTPTCPPPPPLPMCQANYICCTNSPAKPFICAQIIPQCCPRIPIPTCPTPPVITCPPKIELPYCQRNYKCCSNEGPKPYNCWQIIPRCCPKPSPPTCPPTPPPQPPCPVPLPQQYCQRNYICCTNKLPKPYNCPLVVPRCCPKSPCPPVPPPVTCPSLPPPKPCPPQPFCQANYLCCTNVAVKPAICSQVEPVCCPKPGPPICPPTVPPPDCPDISPDPYCKANYICCTNLPSKPAFCPTVVEKCCPIPPPTTCPPPPVPGYCEKNFICCTNQEPKPLNCWDVVPRCCPIPSCPVITTTLAPPLHYCQEFYQCCTNVETKPKFCPTVIMRCCPKAPAPPPTTCPTVPIPPCPPTLPPGTPTPYCQEHYICCTGTGGHKPRICIDAIPRCCPKPGPIRCPEPPPTPQPEYCQANYICCTNRTPKPFNCNAVIQRCCPKPIVPPPRPPCPGPCPYQPPPCMGGCPNYYYPNYPGLYPGNMRPPPPELINGMRPPPPELINGINGKRRRRHLSSNAALNATTTGLLDPCDCETFTNNSLVTVIVTSASQDSYKLLRNQIQIFKNNLKDAITVEIVAYGNAISGDECEFGPGDCLGNRLLSCASDMTEDDASIMAFATCIMASSKLLKNGTQSRILAKAKMCASKYSYSWLDLRDCATSVEGEALLKLAGNRQKEIDSSLEHVPAVYYNEESIWSQSSTDISQLPKLLCKHLIDVPAGRVLCGRMKFINNE